MNPLSTIFHWTLDRLIGPRIDLVKGDEIAVGTVDRVVVYRGHLIWFDLTSDWRNERRTFTKHGKWLMVHEKKGDRIVRWVNDSSREKGVGVKSLSFFDMVLARIAVLGTTARTTLTVVLGVSGAVLAVTLLALIISKLVK